MGPLQGLGRIPDHLSFEEASTLPCVPCLYDIFHGPAELRSGLRSCAALTAYNALLGPIPVKAGDYVLIQGTGGVSMYATSVDPLISWFKSTSSL